MYMKANIFPFSSVWYCLQKNILLNQDKRYYAKPATVEGDNHFLTLTKVNDNMLSQVMV